MIRITEVLPVDGVVWCKNDPLDPPGWCAGVQIESDVSGWDVGGEVGGTLRGRRAGVVRRRRFFELFVYGEEPPPPIGVGDLIVEEP